MNHTFTYKLVTTRKPHRCANCGLKLPTGTKAYSWDAIFDGEFGHGYNCVACNDDMQKNRDDYEEGHAYFDWEEADGEWQHLFVANYGQQPLIDSLQSKLDQLRLRDPRVLVLPSTIKQIEAIEADIRERKLTLEAQP